MKPEHSSSAPRKNEILQVLKAKVWVIFQNFITFISRGSPTSKKLGNSVLCSYTHNISLPNKQAQTGENIEHNFGQRERERQRERETERQRERDRERERENMHKIKVRGKVCNLNFY